MFFTEDQLADIQIDQMVFHLIGPNDEHFVKLQALNPGRFRDFFVERIRSVNSGLPYQFSNASATRERLRRMAENPDVFQDESEGLAESFQRLHGGSAAPGAFLIFALRAAGEQCFALLKYDDETVLSYEFEEDEHGNRVVSLDSLDRTFVQNRDALQKSALIRLNAEDGELTVLDRQNQQKVARYFEGFLDARRSFDDADLTRRLVDVARKVIKENRDLVPENVLRNVTQRTFEATQGGGVLNAENQLSFLNTVVGRELDADDPLVAKFRGALRRARIEGVPIRLDPAEVRRPAAVKLTTENQIQVRVPTEMRGAVEIEDDCIIIRDRVIEQIDDTEATR